MYINSSSIKAHTHRNSLKLDILQLIRMCRERSGSRDINERLEEIVGPSKKTVHYRKSPNKVTERSCSMKTQAPPLVQLPKIAQRSLAKINKKALSFEKAQRNSEQDLLLQGVHSKSIIIELEKVIPQVRQHRVKHLSLLVPSISHTQLQTLENRPMVRSINKQVLPRESRAHKETREYKEVRPKRTQNIITKCGWNVQTKNNWDLAFNQ